jgi:nicotinamidase-related amidase
MRAFKLDVCMKLDSAELARLVSPAHTALLTSECQEGIIGSASRMGALADAVRQGGVVEKIRTLVDSARAMRIPVVHCTVVTRADRGGMGANAPLLEFAMKGKGGALAPGSDAARIVPALGPQESDYVLARLHGVSPFSGTELDAILRNLGVRTIVVTGVSLNVALLGLTIEAVNLGYRVALPRDAVAGTPPDYVELLLKNTLGLLAWITTAGAIVEAWSMGG